MDLADVEGLFPIVLAVSLGLSPLQVPFFSLSLDAIQARRVSGRQMGDGERMCLGPLVHVGDRTWSCGCSLIRR